MACMLYFGRLQTIVIKDPKGMYALHAVVIFGPVSYLLSNLASANCDRIVSKYRKKSADVFYGWFQKKKEDISGMEID